MNTELVSQLLGTAFPEPVSIDVDRVLRRWLVRTVMSLPSASELTALQERLEADMTSTLRSVYPVPERELSLSLPRITLHALDRVHLVVDVECAAPGVAFADSAMILQFGTLDRLDEALPCDDLQGLPWEAWFPLREARRRRSGEPS